MIGCDVIYDFVKENGFKTPELYRTSQGLGGHCLHWGGCRCMPHRLGQPQWRVAYVEPSGLPDSKEEILHRAHERLQRYIKGRKDFRITRAEPYWLHQRCAAQARKGRFLLAEDALHSDNPIGGLGLTGGILDAFAYGNALTQVLIGREPDSVLTECSNSRRGARLDTTNTLSTANTKRLYGFDEESVKAREGFFIC